MVTVINGSSANELLIKATKELQIKGKLVAPRGLSTLELQDVFLVLENPAESTITIPERKLSFDYLDGEMAWYLSGSLRADDIAKHSKFWLSIANSDGTVNSNYGFLALVELHNGKSQYDWCLESLLRDVNSRQAVINYNQPRHKYFGNKDFVCTIAQTFRVNDGKLDSTVLMRSNDLIMGFCYDVVWFTYLQQKMAKELGISVGVYNHYAASLHVYEKHFGMIKQIAEVKDVVV